MTTIDEEYHHIVVKKNGFVLTIEDLIKLHDNQFVENENNRRNSGMVSIFYSIFIATHSLTHSLIIHSLIIHSFTSC